jgi:serine/threonine protein kinase
MLAPIPVSGSKPRGPIVVGNLLGRGGFGTCREVTYNGQLVVMKRFDQSATADDDARREVAIAAACDGHPHLPLLLDAFVFNGCPCLVYRHAGRDLAQVLAQSSSSAAPGFVLSNVPALSLHVASGLAFLHAKGFAHTDVKTQNILVKQSPQFQAVLVDVGSAVEARKGRRTRMQRGSACQHRCCRRCRITGRRL